MKADDFYAHFLNAELRPLSDSTARMRRNMMVYSLLVIFWVFGSGGISQGSSFFGVQFEDLKTSIIFLFLVSANIYFLIGFVLEGVDDYYGCLVRLTSLHSSVSSSFGDIATNPGTKIIENGSLLSWYAYLLRSGNDMIVKIESMENSDVNALRARFEQAMKFADITKAGIKRFEDGFWSHHKRKLLVWMLFEMFGPILFSVFSIISGLLYSYFKFF